MAAVLADPVEYFPGPNVKTDAQILETIRKTLHTVYHASGTCKMGKSGDPAFPLRGLLCDETKSTGALTACQAF